VTGRRFSKRRNAALPVSSTGDVMCRMQNDANAMPLSVRFYLSHSVCPCVELSRNLQAL